MIFLQGQTIRVKLSVKVAGALVDPSSVVLKLLRPDGVTVSPSVAHDGTGLYSAVVLLDVAGRWVRAWTTTGNGADGYRESWWTVNAREVAP